MIPIKKLKCFFNAALVFAMTAATVLTSVHTAKAAEGNEIILKINGKKVTKKLYKLQKGKKVKLRVSANAVKGGKKVTFTSSKKTIASVSAKGTVTAKKKGVAKITVKVTAKGCPKDTWVKIKVTKGGTSMQDTITEKPVESPFKKVPDGYTAAIEQAGKIEAVDYKTTDYRDNSELSKRAYVYLPYGYDETKQYTVIYCLHGGEGNALAYLGTSQSPGAVARVLDNMIANGDIEPVIAVAPTYYLPKGNRDAVKDIVNFKSELLNDLIPAVEGKYSTYAETTDLEGLKASREHRAYTGFSMGSFSTWTTLIQCNEYFKYYMPMSGDCWINGASNAAGAAKELERVYKESGYSQNDIFVYAVTGDKDIAYNAMKSQISSMQTLSPSFVFTDESSLQGNISFKVEPGATHDYRYLPLYLYNGLLTFFGKQA